MFNKLEDKEDRKLLEEILGPIVIIAVIIVIVSKIFEVILPYLLIMLGILVICIIVYSIIKTDNQRVERLEKEEQERQNEEARFKYGQESYYKEMVNLGGSSIYLFESLPKELVKAEKYLNQAEIDFSDGAFAPFWDSIEEATKSLSYFVKGTKLIEENSSEYTKLIGEYEGISPQYPLSKQSIEKLGVSTTTAKRMESIVRTAQRDFQFASIYEQRKTNQILIAGFTNLADALKEMTWTINDSIADLTASVGETGLRLNESMSKIQSQIDHVADDFTKEATEREKRERKALEMLDNIQRDRRPLL